MHNKNEKLTIKENVRKNVRCLMIQNTTQNFVQFNKNLTSKYNVQKSKVKPILRHNRNVNKSLDSFKLSNKNQSYLLPENGFGLTTETLLFAIVTPSALSEFRLLGFLVLSHLVFAVLIATRTVSPSGFGDINLKKSQRKCFNLHNIKRPKFCHFKMENGILLFQSSIVKGKRKFFTLYSTLWSGDCLDLTRFKYFLTILLGTQIGKGSYQLKFCCYCKIALTKPQITNAT